MELMSIYPMRVEVKYNYLSVDEVYIATICIMKCERNIELLDTIKKIICLDEIEISFHFEKLDSVELLKKLTNIIAKSTSEIKSISENQVDINLIDNIKHNATNLRKKIQVNNEQIYNMSTYILVKDKNLQELNTKIKKVVNTLYSSSILAKPCNFKQKEAYLATLPIMRNELILKKHNNCILTENGVTKLFPFYNEDIFENKGAIIGKANGNLCSIDIFSNKNSNYNMCIFGTSGAGKSYFVKLLLIKNAYKGIRQIIVDPEGEYIELVQKLGGNVYTIDNYNPFEIAENFVSEEKFFEKKISQIENYLKDRFNIVCNQQHRQVMIDLYNKYGISEDKESLYVLNEGPKIYTKPKYKEQVPTLQEYLNYIGCNSMLDKLKTNGDREEKQRKTEIFCFHLKGRTAEEIKKEMRLFLPKLMELIKRETIIYFDELWKCIYSDKDGYVIETIYNMFKTFRKKKASTVIISQDICDLFNVDNGNFGKSILNNTSMKVLFKMEWSDIEILERLLKNKEQIEIIKRLERGKAYMSVDNTNFELQIQGTEFEHKLIEGEII